ncbi:hypothetical protein BSZ35_12640 [Salinibacter sp. 10B]|uniref:hypothetical protein n=1 Tax=Salinibacter sp. 10B TaxID=1923971 RepID=UPI000CF3ADF2|nr:hypothetical protein [Salinibacter sp. 10B]PQJ35335.1 hypothetical protein BSZ35_12640 [Salinibacter sp. 10B]
MHHSFLRYTRLLLIPLLAVGLVLTGCDSTGSNGGDNGDETSTFEYPSNDYGSQTVANLLAFDLGIRTGSDDAVSNNSASNLKALYTGDMNDTTVPSIKGSPEQSVYGDFEGTVNLSSLTDDTPLVRSQYLENGDSPDPESQISTNQMLEFYLERAGSENIVRTDNGIVLSQFAEKMLLGTPIYGRGAAILNDFANGNVSGDQAEQWDKAFGYFGFPRALEPFLDYSGGVEGLATDGGDDPIIARDLDENGSVDLTSEYVHTWAAYAIERSAAAQQTGEPNDFAGKAFEALVQGRKDIENGDSPSDHAQTALNAWEKVVAVNVIHYINSMESTLNSDEVSGTLSQGDIDEGAWGEAKAFAWGLQFYNSALSETQLNDILEDIGNAPPYGEMTAEEYANELEAATGILQDAYDFKDTNVQNW